MSSNYNMTKLRSGILDSFSDSRSLLKISFGSLVILILSSVVAYAETLSVDVEGNSFDVDYTATGMTVSGVETDLDFISLILSVDVTDSTGTLDIMFDRSFFDSKFQGVDDDFIILADGDEPIFTEIETTSQSRTLSIQVPGGTEEIEIIGSIFGAPTPEPIVEPPEPIVDTPKTQCGPGTILKDGECVLDSTPKPTETSVGGMSKELVISFIAAFIIAGAIAVIFALMSKASKSKD